MFYVYVIQVIIGEKLGQDIVKIIISKQNLTLFGHATHDKTIANTNSVKEKTGRPSEMLVDNVLMFILSKDMVQ